MSNFEKVAASPETLGAFLSSLHVATGPWDESFHRTFCDSCERENCDVEHCPHQDTRNNPTLVAETGRGTGRSAGTDHQGQGGVPYRVGPEVLHRGRKEEGAARPLYLLRQHRESDH